MPRLIVIASETHHLKNGLGFIKIRSRKVGIMILIRKEKTSDRQTIREINEFAFGQGEEADIVDALRQNCDELLSLVAVVGGHVVGHILFSPVTIEKSGQEFRGMGLAPMAVLPSHQGGGVGSALVRRGLGLLKEQNYPFVIVMGHPSFYPRFGFEKASVHGIQPQWEGIPDEAFMIAILDPHKMAGVKGVATYRSEFDIAV